MSRYTLAFDIINKYKKENAEQDDFIFPVITNKELYLKDDEYRYTFIESANKAANFQLQRIAKKLEIPVKVTFHISRHTFATNALNNGMRIEHVSKLMDHRDISTTQVYAKIISEELDKAVDNYIY
uniref:tyrosine-type recombinase/integrase n=1 Tax=Flavobacterium sp. TaxID=239 RepID=UPI0040487EF3